MKQATIAFLLGGLLIGAVTFAATRQNRPSPAPLKPGPGAPTPDKTPDGDAPIPPSDEAARLRQEIESLRRQIAELEGAKKNAEIRKGDESDPVARAYAGMKLMDDALKTKLGLTPEQEQRMRDAILKFLKESQAVWTRQDLTFQQKETEVERLKTALEPEFQAILSATQYAEMNAARNEKKAKAREAAVSGESRGYNQFLALDETQQKQMEAIVRGYTTRTPRRRRGTSGCTTKACVRRSRRF